MWISFDKIQNVRDLGGIRTEDGRTLRMGRLLRGAGLENATEDDLRKLQELKLRHIVDFRDCGECERMPDPPVEGAEYHSFPALPGLPGGGGPPRPNDRVGEPNFPPLFCKIYGEMATTERSREAYRDFFHVLLNCEEGAVYFHCAQGKDRTGVGAILILMALGVSKETAVEEYLLSNIGLQGAVEEKAAETAGRWSRKTVEELFNVYPEILHKFFDGVEQYGGVQGYLRNRIGLTDADFERLRSLYLE